MQKYDPKSIEAKWQSYWEENKTFSTPKDSAQENKFYVLPQLPYPSGSGLHVGHAEVYTACDIYARYQRMKGKTVLQVFGLDSFGLPAENYAIKTNVHPKQTIDETGANFVEQVKKLGVSVDWDRFVRSSDPEYYKFTQWFFLLMYERGLAYRKTQAVNWCDSCKTVLANAQVVDGHCERCDTVVVQKDMEQWYLKITDYAEKLLEGLDRIDWPEETKKRQRDWIGKSEGAEIEFKISNSKLTITVFTTRPDTLFGATYMVLAPEGQYVQELKGSIKNWNDVESYITETSKKTELERQTQKEKTGVELKGVKAVNPANGEEIPIWIADYVIATYGTGAIMAVPAHDERDFEFVDFVNSNPKYKTESVIKIRHVVEPDYEMLKENDVILKFVIRLNEGKTYIEDLITSLQYQYTDILKKNGQSLFTFVGKHGHAINSDFLNGLTTEDAKEKMIDWLEEHNIGKRKIQYKLRDWSVSRQRFWGAPLPMVVNEQLSISNKQYVFIHGYGGNAEANFFPWLKKQLEEKGHTVVALDLPNTDKPNVKEQAEFLKKQVTFDEHTVIIAHSLGGPVAFRILEALEIPISKLILADSVLRPEFNDGERLDVTASDSFVFDFEKIAANADAISIISDAKHVTIKKEHIDTLSSLLHARHVEVDLSERHLMVAEIPALLEEALMTGVKPVPFSDLPVLLPEDVDFKPTGQSPLTYSKTFQAGIEEMYGEGWKREVNTLDTFMCSSWYFFRYLDPHNEEAFASPEALKTWMPVDFYLGGPEHVNGHLLYSRFFTKVLFDAGYIDFDEPFKVHRHQGLILGPDGRKMSKRWGNVINPSDVVDVYGADTMRMYEMFMGPLEDDKPWDENGVKGIRRFLDKVWNLQEKVSFGTQSNMGSFHSHSFLHKTIKKVTEDLENLKFNTAIAEMMKLVNEFYKAEHNIGVESYRLLIKMLSPFAPHISEELWEKHGDTKDSFNNWPSYNTELMDELVMTLAIQINGKVRDTLTVATVSSEEHIKKMALASEKVKKWLDGNEPKKVIYVKGKIVNVVV
ncbi:MAG: Leucine-tRNA ligase [Candidatus Magasanikbacteria bacterium GW2011_GWE2_42_7]|uniref:Leucine--tRNA ligase n=1 Tax=Candidatus Magasanikbacteria bacterium GW2011_GWE2_42_7 TaxID=1619052 RepID=A0A0G1BG30_9BACT|nr:MAG: Leucine-tRNA ligase [Candidatus Magasanikbacteria bacterium GW2011_GWE2_42_7]